jgi:predicted chitinase
LFYLRAYLFGETGKLSLPSNTPTFAITGAQLKLIFPSTAQSRCDEVAALINKYSTKFGIDNAVRMSHFLGQIGAETQLKYLSELSYSKNDMLTSLKTRTLRKHNNKWVLKYCDLFENYNTQSTNNCPFPYCDNDIEIPDEYVYSSANANYVTSAYMQDLSNLVPKSKYDSGNPENMGFFDYVYACQLDNGSIDAKDGSRFRGRGFMQLTGYVNYRTILQAKWDAVHGKGSKDFLCRSKECDTNLELVATDLEMSMQTALTFGAAASANDAATDIENNTIDRITFSVNGAYNAKEDRREITKKAYQTLNK